MRTPTPGATALWISAMWLTLAGGGAPAAEPDPIVDQAQGDAALRMIREGDTVRLYCLPCTDVAYGSVVVESRGLRPRGEGFRLLLNGDAVDLSTVYVDDGYGAGWKNLAVLLGFIDSTLAPELKPSLADAARLAPYSGSYAGTLGGAAIELELLMRGRGLVGSYSSAGGKPMRLVATVFGGPRGAETLVLVERDDDDRVTATLRGELAAAAGTFAGDRTPLDGSPAQAFRLRRTDED